MTKTYLPEVDPHRCPFCKIAVAHEVGSEPLAEDLRIHKHKWYETMSFIPLGPVVPGHRLFTPMAHRAHPDAFGAAEAVREAQKWAKAQGVPYNLITSAGSVATQTVEHLHVHYVPRVKGDGLRLPWTTEDHECVKIDPKSEEFTALVDGAIDREFHLMERLRELRKARGVSSKKMARDLVMSEDRLYDIETLAASPSMRDVRWMANRLGVRIEYRIVDAL